MRHATVAEDRDEMIHPDLFAHRINLLQALVGRAGDLDVDEPIHTLLRASGFGVIRNHSIVLVAFNGFEVPVREMVMRVSGSPVPAHILPRSLARLLGGFSAEYKA